MRPRATSDVRRSMLVAFAGLAFVACTCSREETAPARVEAPREAPAVLPPPSAPTPSPDDPTLDERTCAGPDDCLLVARACGPVASVRRADAAAVQARYDRESRPEDCRDAPRRPASVPQCAAPQNPAIPPGTVTNGRATCIAFPLPHPEVRRCMRDAECVALDTNCQWTPVARFSQRDARMLMPVGPGCPGIMPAPPEVRCTFDFCSFATDTPPR